MPEQARAARQAPATADVPEQVRAAGQAPAAVDVPEQVTALPDQAGGGPESRAGRSAVEKVQAWSAVVSAVLSVAAIVLSTMAFADQRGRQQKQIAARVSIVEGLLPTRVEGQLGAPGIVIRNRAPSPIFKSWLLVDRAGRTGLFYLDAIPPCVVLGLPKEIFTGKPVPDRKVVVALWFADDEGRGWQRLAGGELDPFAVPIYQGAATALPGGRGLPPATAIDATLNSEPARLARGMVIRDASDCSEAN
ncbi:hypothetical protein [Jidongwangia harbinensis]|uniref:hypothetical protein n=1 Tax=Jidongwangia harbinensis TaxID=2878561 RepID=UPI001CDA5359|nr:hypothetical protein [Jidongwangia harbinensis]MCA2216033.1 hypothetical protein [Jidongwangia harbinensis]